MMLPQGLDFQKIRFVTVSLSDVEPQNKEDEGAEKKQVADVVVALRLQHLPNLPCGVCDDGAHVVETIVQAAGQILLVFQLHPNFDRNVI